MRDTLDTIAAIATPPGTGAVGIVRVSGPEARVVAEKLTGISPNNTHIRRLSLATLRRENGAPLDQVLWTWMPGPRSFTGEDVVEFQGHGGPVNMAQILREALGAGARAAQPGEFARRAFAHGRIDLTEAEAVLAVINAKTERALQVAQRQLAGQLGHEIRGLRTVALELLAEVEAIIDFPEEELEEKSPGALADSCAVAAKRCLELLQSADSGLALTEGATVALVGPVNAGKSSLLNALVGDERALVDAEPGTTRDVVEARVIWDGVAVTLVDTAGLRETDSNVEHRGIAMGQARAQHADLILELCPAANFLEASSHRKRFISVASKCDLASPNALSGLPHATIATSTVHGTGLDTLKAAIVTRLLGDTSRDEVVLTSERQRDAVSVAERAFVSCARLLRESQPRELIAIEARTAADALSTLLGEGVGEALLDQLFARFCLGK